MYRLLRCEIAQLQQQNDSERRVIECTHQAALDSWTNIISRADLTSRRMLSIDVFVRARLASGRPRQPCWRHLKTRRRRQRRRLLGSHTRREAIIKPDNAITATQRVRTKSGHRVWAIDVRYAARNVIMIRLNMMSIAVWSLQPIALLNTTSLTGSSGGRAIRTLLH